MIDTKIVKRSLLNAVLAVAYIALISTVMANAERIFGPGPDGKSVIVPIGFLSLLVVSVATMGALIFGKPVMLYMDGKKREAVMMCVYTIATLAIITVLVFVAIAVFK